MSTKSNKITITAPFQIGQKVYYLNRHPAKIKNGIIKKIIFITEITEKTQKTTISSVVLNKNTQLYTNEIYKSKEDLLEAITKNID